MKIRKKGVHFWSFVTAAPVSVLHRCSNATYRKVKVVGGAILFTAFTSGLLMSLSVWHYTEQDHFTALAAFTFWGSLLFVLDRIFVSSRKPLNLSAFLLRAIPILASILLIDVAISTVVFEKSISQELNRQNSLVTDSITKAYQIQLDAKDSMIVQTRKEMTARREGEARLNWEFVRELKGEGATGEIGHGEVATSLERSLDKTIGANQAEYLNDSLLIQGYLAEKERLLLERDQKTSHPTELADLGPLDRADLLSQVLFRPGHAHLVLFSIGILVVICIIELLPLIAKHQIRYGEISTLAKREVEFNLAEQQKRDELKRELLDKQAHHAIMNRLSELEMEHQKEEQKLAANAIMDAYRKKIITIRQLMNETKENEQYAHGEFLHLINQAAIIARQEMGEIFSSTTDS